MGEGLLEKSTVTGRPRLRGLGRAFQVVGLPLLAIAAVALNISEAHRRGDLAVDFRTVSPEIRGLIEGVNPYVAESIGAGGQFQWTILSGWLLSPLAWLPHGYLLVVALEIVGVIAAALLLGVRDWRLISIAFLWPATLNSIQSSNITVLVLVFLAAAWFDRGRTRSGLWVGLAVAVKLFAWPALVWLAATRRWRALALAAGVQVVGVLVTLPYLSLSEYVSFTREVDRLLAPQSLTLNALLQDLGTAPGLARAATLVVGAAILWRGRRDLGWVVVAMLVLSPVVWLHYYGLLLIPLAVWSAPLLVWCVPLLLVVTPGKLNGDPWQTAATLAIASIAVGAAWRWRRA